MIWHRVYRLHGKRLVAYGTAPTNTVALVLDERRGGKRPTAEQKSDAERILASTVVRKGRVSAARLLSWLASVSGVQSVGGAVVDTEILRAVVGTRLLARGGVTVATVRHPVTVSSARRALGLRVDGRGWVAVVAATLAPAGDAQFLLEDEVEP